MAVPSGKMYPVGLQFVRAYKLDSNGHPSAAQTGAGLAYEGIEISAPKSFDITPAKSRDVVHVGNNRRLSQDKLPATDVSSATIKTSRLDFAINELLSGNKAHTMGESILTGFNTSNQGTEPAVALLMYQQAKAYGTGTRVWSSYHIPSAVAIVDPASMNDNPSEYTYSLAPSSVNHHIFGPLFTVSGDGFTEAELVWSETDNIPMIVSWLPGATGAGLAVCLFPIAKLATATTKIHNICKVASDGTVTDLTTTGATRTVSGVTISGATNATDQIIVFYEYSAS